eukprot:SAG31_NODE_47007_length_252_cov_0.666667_1_plen_84_part_11
MQQVEQQWVRSCMERPGVEPMVKLLWIPACSDRTFAEQAQRFPAKCDADQMRRINGRYTGEDIDSVTGQIFDRHGLNGKISEQT